LSQKFIRCIVTDLFSRARVAVQQMVEHKIKTE